MNDHTCRETRQQVDCADDVFWQVYNLAPIPLAILDREGRVLAANQAFEAWFGLAPADLLGKELPPPLRPPGRLRTVERFVEYPKGRRFLIRILRHPLRVGDTATFLAFCVPGVPGAVPAPAVTIAEALEEERSRIARELHDDTGQSLAALLLGLMALLDRLSGPQDRERVGELIFSVSSIIEGVRRMLRGLRPLALEKEGLVSAMSVLTGDFSSLHGIATDLQVTISSGTRFTEATEVTVFRFVQESLSNVARHSEATRACVLITYREGLLRALVEDNGIGFPPDTCGAPQSFGLLGLRERINLLGGLLEIESVPGRTTINVTLPCREINEQDQSTDRG